MITPNAVIAMWLVPVMMTIGLPLVVTMVCSVNKLAQKIFSSEAIQSRCFLARMFASQPQVPTV